MGRMSWVMVSGVTLLWVIGSASFPGMRQIGRGNTATAICQLRSFAEALGRVRADKGEYPRQERGLGALMEVSANRRSASRWKRSYLPDCTQIPLDPWGNVYLYETVDFGQTCRVTSLGADGRLGGRDYGADLSISLPRN